MISMLMSILVFVVITMVTFFTMEAVAYLAHKHLFHGVLWFLHRSHHEPHSNRLEWNDLFGVVFAPVAIVLMGGYLQPSWLSFTYPIGLGMTLYGCVYFFIHDIYTHRRFWTLNIKSQWFKEMRSAHRHHHANVMKLGQEPFGFLFFKKAPARKPARSMTPSENT